MFNIWLTSVCSALTEMFVSVQKAPLLLFQGNITPEEFGAFIFLLR